MPTPSRVTRQTLDSTAVPLRAFQVFYKTFTELQKEHNALRLSNGLPKQEEETIPMPSASSSDPQPALQRENNSQNLIGSDWHFQLKRREEELARKEAALSRKEMDLKRREAKIRMAPREAMLARKASEWSRHTGKIWLSRISQLYNEVDETGKALDSILAEDEMNIIGLDETLEEPPNLEGTQQHNRLMTSVSPRKISTSLPRDEQTRLSSEIDPPYQVTKGSLVGGSITPPQSIPKPKRKNPPMDHSSAPRGRKRPEVVPFIELHPRTRSSRGKGGKTVHCERHCKTRGKARGRKIGLARRSSSPAV